MKIATSLLLCLLLCSCASSRRMMSISPFSEGQASRMPDSKRVNMWPLVYHNRDATSVLWPIIDFNDQGFAVRPLINKEKDDWSILFPLSGWNTADKEGWVLSAYHYGADSGVFPLFNIGDKFSYVLPAWWTDGGHGVFPLYGWSDDLRHIGPVWWETAGDGAGLFPLYDHDVTETRTRRNVLFGILAHLQDRDKDDYTHWVFPCWYSDADKDSSTRMLLPVFIHHRDGDDRLILTPLGGRGWSKDGTTFMVNVVGPVYHYHRQGEHTFHAALWPIFTMSDGVTWRLWPIVSHTGDKGSKGALHDMVLMGITNKDKHKGVSCLGPIVFDYDRKLHADGRPDWDLAFLLAGRLWHNVNTREGVPTPQGPWRQSCVESKGRDLFIAHHSTETFRVWRPGMLTREEKDTLWRWQTRIPESERVKSATKIADILRRHGTTLADDQPATVQAALQAFAEENTELVDTVKMGIPMLYNLKRSGKDSDWKVLFGVFNGKRVKDRSTVSVLRYLYRRERNGTSVSRDFFPFCTWDSGPDHGRFSFLWHLLNYERNGDRRSGHLLFIPWGA